MKKIAEAFNGHGTGTRLFAVFLAAFICQAQQAASAADLGKIMPMGDSITLGVPVAGGYRDPLYTLLTNRADTFTFVGSQTGYATTALTDAGQTHHEGHSGYVITNGTGRTGLDENLASWIGPGKESPDKILLMIGSNDINLGYNMTNAPARLSDLITHIYGCRPNVRLYVASIIPMVGHESDVQAFNAAIPDIVASHRSLGHDVVYVSMHDALNISTDLADGLHPNAQGYLHMAQAWDAALHASTDLAAAVAYPANNRVFAVGTSISATATVANASGAYAVHIYTNSGAGTFAEAGTGGASSPYRVSLGTLPAGTYHIYASVSDTLATMNTATNTFTVVAGIHAVDVASAGSGPGLGTRFSVGWDFTVTRPLVITSLGQFDPDSSPKSNTVAIYRRGGAKLIETALPATSPAEQSGLYLARYATVDHLVLTNGNYVVVSTQNGENFIAPDGNPGATFGSAITWNKGVALGEGSAAGPLPTTAPGTWPIENASASRYFGPTFKYELVAAAPALALTGPTNTQSFAAFRSISALATVSNATGAYAVHIYTNSGSGTFAEAGAGGSASPYQVSLGTLPVGTYHICASVSDTLATTNTATNTFTVVATGPQMLGLAGWNKDLIIGKTETAPGYNAIMAGWNFYEYGLTNGSQGLPADAAGTNRTFASSRNAAVKFQFAPYTANNALYLDGPGSATLTLATPARFYALQFLMTARTMSWYAKLNFSDGTSTTTSTWSDPDWTANPGASDRCLTSYGLKKAADGTFYTGYLWMAERAITLSAADRAKTLASITFTATGAASYQLAVFAVSGYVLDPESDTMHAVDVTSAGDGASGGSGYSVGWDFTVSETVTITSLGQFDPNSNSKDNTVAIYRRGGAKLVETTVAAASPSELSGLYLARYVPIHNLVLTNGNYVVVSTQNGDNFIAGGGSPAATFGPGVKWNKGVALAEGSAAGPLPAIAPEPWPINNPSAYRYFGPTFTYKLGAVWPKGLLVTIR